MSEPDLAASLTVRFEAVMLDWDEVRCDPLSDASVVRDLVSTLCARGVGVAFVSDADVESVDGWLGVRPPGPGRLLLVVSRGSEVFEVGVDGPRLVVRSGGCVESGLTDKSDSARAVLGQFWIDGIAPELVLVSGNQFGEQCAGRYGPVLDLLREQVQRRADVPRVVVYDGWSFVVDAFDPVAGRSNEALLTIADGVIGTNGAPLFTHPAARPELVAAGVYDGEGPLVDLLAGPLWATLARELTSDDSVRRVLDLRGGLLGEDVAGGDTMQSVRFSSLARPGVAVLRADVDPCESSDALVAPDGPVVTSANGEYEWMATRGTGGSITAAAWQECDASRLDRIAAYVPGIDGAEPEKAAANLASARAEGFDALLAEHRRAWAQRWESADVSIEGDDQLQLEVRLALFHLMASASDRGEAAVGARGLTGHAYRGHVFWDADLFVLPFLAATEPAAARAILQYRCNRLPAALAAARAEGRQGARFPWESADSGFDVTPRAGRDRSGQIVPIRTGEAEVHIVADVAWAVCCYVDWTDDQEYATGDGRRILIETARYWVSRIRLDPTGRAHLYGVIGPDEYHEPVDDNAFTNVLARWNLRRAAISAATVDDGAVDASELETWRHLADALVDGFDPASRLYEEFAGYSKLEPLLIRDVAPQRPITADQLLGPERVRRTQIVKQADVLMLHHLLPDEVEPGSLGANLDYYEPRTAHGSSLSPAVHAALFARAGRMDAALDALRIATGIDTNDRTRTGAGGVHLGTMGGIWQALAYGFAGLRPRGDALTVDPCLPDAWSALELRIRFHGVALRLRVEPDAIVATASSPIALVVDGDRVECGAGETRVQRSNRKDA